MKVSKLITCVATLGFTVLTFTVASPAIAQPVVGDTPSAEHDIRCEQTSLTISLPKPNPYDQTPNDGLAEPTGEGFEISAQRVAGLDLSKSSEWVKIGGLTPKTARDMGLVGDRVTLTTNSDAKVTFNNLPIGLYLITATAPQDPHYKISHLDDFLVSVPLGQGDHWDCAVKIDAKTHYDVEPVPPTPHEPPVPPTPVPPLAITGAQILIAGVVSTILIVGGLILVVRRRKDAENNLNESVSEDSLEGQK
ncbi:hypothetical protein JTE88_01045 [Arcanobacterium phocisimile]|uniref:LPXTG-motif cell wall anchor domain-containing protein n=1 Tax=Arcanobacterium phocisimile TaxID=1302235 RepID=A0ABX7IGX3_9ACTO|nr:hypothetical protein [Arcanobacterium phocisimile]QRV02381.1 hypothetical protein JTE88_01045 [Arcanobacterium phocisimile]